MVTASCGAGPIPPTILPGVRRLLLPLLFASLALASCGGGDDREDVEGLVDTAFSQEMTSADLKLDAEVQLEGSPVFDRPLRIQAAGPFRTNEGKLPSADLEVEIGSDGGGQIQFSIEFRNVNADQEIEAPRKARPLSKLTRSLGGLDALIELAGGDDAPTDQGDLGADEPEAAPPSGETGSEPPSDESGTAPEEAFREYAECLDDARPEDTEALQACAELLHRP